MSVPVVILGYINLAIIYTSSRVRYTVAEPLWEATNTEVALELPLPIRTLKALFAGTNILSAGITSPSTQSFCPTNKAEDTDPKVTCDTWDGKDISVALVFTVITLKCGNLFCVDKSIAMVTPF